VLHAEVRGDPKDYLRARKHREIYMTVSHSMLDENKDNSSSWFTGVPGIGKSMFLLYFIYRFLEDDRFSNKTFAVEFI
jgi:putative protein kinase ArgK-like GTPase of G3E family